ncbi:MAG: hypothetical protein FJY99_13330 [Candidatus Sericytochromatia bacterium]|nr:hypothetical protein [Candidatus Tanganyikabacteria bacterium]
MAPDSTARRPLPPVLLDRLATDAGELEGLQAIVRFGSHGTARQRIDSDLDLAFLGCRPWPPSVLADLATRLDPLSDLPVQCVDLRAVPGLVALEMLEDAEPVLVRDALALGLFQTHLDAERLNLARWRSGILEDIARRGTVRGG